MAQLSASWLSGGLFQRQIVLQAARSFGAPRPISRSGRMNAGTQATPALVSTWRATLTLTLTLTLTMFHMACCLWS